LIRPLQAGRGIDQHLRADRHVEFLEQVDEQRFRCSIEPRRPDSSSAFRREKRSSGGRVNIRAPDREAGGWRAVSRV
jgi:hypothetical protein